MGILQEIAMEVAAMGIAMGMAAIKTAIRKAMAIVAMGSIAAIVHCMGILTGFMPSPDMMPMAFIMMA